MSGHNKWSGIKHRKEAQDSKRAKVFTKITKNIIVAVQQGGSDVTMNPTLKTVLATARAANMPNDNIDRAIKRATGDGSDARIEEVVYEAYGPGNVAMLVLCATDNTNRAVTDVKTALKKNGGKFVTGGSVSFQFAREGRIVVATDVPDDVELAAIDAGATDVVRDDGVVIVFTALEDLHRVRQEMESAGHAIEDAQAIYRPAQTVTVSGEDAAAYEKLYDILDELDDVQEIYDNRA